MASRFAHLHAGGYTLYDSQQEVYTAMLEELELANSLYNASLGLDDPTKDGIYGGDIAKWQKFTNTLRLRLLMRVSGRNNAFTPTVGEQINQIISNPGKYPVFESNDDNATVKFSGSAEYYKTYFNSSSFPDAGCTPAVVINHPVVA